MTHQVAPGELTKLLQAKALAPGDIIQLVPGALYPAMHLQGLRQLQIICQGEPAIIDGGDGHALVLEGCEDIRLENLRLRGTGRKYHSKQGVGLLVLGGSNIEGKGCEASGFQRSGFEARGVRHLKFDSLYAHDNGYSGIHVTRGDDDTWSEHVEIQHCRAVNNPGDPQVTTSHSGNGIVLYYARDAEVSYCTAAYNGWDMDNSAFNGPVGIWCANTQRAQFRYCLSHDNRTQWGKTDGGGFDFDGGTRDCLIEYCYSYHNAGAGYMFCQYVNAQELSGNTIRYSTSFNDGTAYHQSALYLFDCGSQSLAQGGNFYRNLLYNSKGRDIVRGHIDDCFIYENLMLLSGEGEHFRHIHDDAGLQHRGPDRQAWGQVSFERNQLVRLEQLPPDAPVRQLSEYPRLQDAQELPAYFQALNLEGRSIPGDM